MLFSTDTPFEAVAEKLNGLRQVTGRAFEAREHRSADLVVAARAGVRIVAPESPPIQEEEINLSAMGTWELFKDKDGKVRLRNVEHGEFHAVRARIIEKHVAAHAKCADVDPDLTASVSGVFDFFTNIADGLEWLGDRITDTRHMVILAFENF